MAEEVGFTCDMREFERLLEEDKEKSRKGSKFAVDLGKYKGSPLTVFTGFDGTGGAGEVSVAGPNELVLDRTPFYAESGGQLGDSGFIRDPEGKFTFVVHDTKKAGQVFIHVGEWTEGSHELVKQGMPVLASVDAARRQSMERNHTATHLLHWALHQVLDGSATQKGSEVSPGRLRFDFAWGKQVGAEELKEIERLVNEKIAGNAQVNTAEMPIDQARGRGAIAMFGENYGDVVRVVDIDSYSVELCGGPTSGAPETSASSSSPTRGR
jgi:alanyl-tRNA synthetase